MQANVMEASSLRQESLASSHAASNTSASFLDLTIPLQDASHGDVVGYSVETIWRKAECIATLADGRKAKLRDAWQFIAYTGHNPARRLLFRNNGLHLEVQIDSNQLIVAVEQGPSGNLFGVIKSAMTTLFAANRNSLTRVLNRRRTYTAVDGSQVSLAACSS
jgi:hypothetical protein